MSDQARTTVSVVVPVYNPGKHIEDLIASLGAQTLPAEEFEVIFVDDGSTDDTPARLDALAAERSNVTVIHEEASGWSGKPRNVGIDTARGEYVMFVDNDDWLADEALRRMYDYATANHADILVPRYAGHRRPVAKGLFKRAHPSTTIAKTPAVIDSLTPHKMFRRDFLLEHGVRFPEGRRRLEDHVFVTEAYLRAEVISVYSDHVCYYHVRRDDDGNAGFRPIEPESYFANVREALDIVVRLTEPGALRDRLLRRWYRNEMLNRLNGKRFLDHDEEYAEELFTAVRTLAGEGYFGPGVVAGLPAPFRIRSELLAQGDLATYRAFVASEQTIGAQVSLDRLRWTDSGSLRLELSGSLDRAELALLHQKGEQVLLALSDEIAERVPSELIDVTGEIGKGNVEVVVRNRTNSAEFVLTGAGTVEVAAATREAEQVPGPRHLTFAAHAELDPTTIAAGDQLWPGAWDLYVKVTACGWSQELRVGANRPADMTAPPPALDPTLGFVQPYWTTPRRDLSIDVEESTRSIATAWRPEPGDAKLGSSGGGTELELDLPLRPAPQVPTRQAELLVGPGADAHRVSSQLVGTDSGTGRLHATIPEGTLAAPGTYPLSVSFGHRSGRLGLSVAVDEAGVRRVETTIKVSVVVPVYNPGKHIEDLIGSLVRQDLPRAEYEMIFVDDGSTDDTPARLDALAAEESNVTVIHEEASGWSGKPRNVGIDTARGEYVMFVDNDDWLGDEALRRMYDYATANHADILVPKMAGVGRGVPRELFKVNRPRANLDNAPLIDSLTPHKMVRRAFLLEHGIRFPEGRRRLEDHVFVTEAYLLAQNVSVLSDYVCYYHIRRDDESNAAYETIEPEGYFSNLREALDIVAEHTEPGALRDKLHRRWLRTEMLERLRGRRLLDMPEERRERWFAEIRSIVAERFGSGVAAEFPSAQRLIAALASRGSVQDLVRLAEWEAELAARAELTEVAWNGDGLDIELTARLRDGSGPVRFRSDGEEVLLDAPLSSAAEESLTAGDRDATADLARARVDVVLVERDGGGEYYLPATTEYRRIPLRGEASGSFGVDLACHARLDPATAAGNRPLPEGIWDLRVRIRMCGWTKDTRIRKEFASPGLLLGQPSLGVKVPRVVVPYWTAHDVLSVDADSSPSRWHKGLQIDPDRVTVDGDGAISRLRIPTGIALRGRHADAHLLLAQTGSERVEELGAHVESQARSAQDTGSGGVCVLADVSMADLVAGSWTVDLRLNGMPDRWSTSLPFVLKVPNDPSTPITVRSRHVSTPSDGRSGLPKAAKRTARTLLRRVGGLYRRLRSR